MNQTMSQKTEFWRREAPYPNRVGGEVLEIGHGKHLEFKTGENFKEKDRAAGAQSEGQKV